MPGSVYAWLSRRWAGVTWLHVVQYPNRRIQMEVTRTLASFVVASRPDRIPGAAQHEASRSMLNWLGCAIGGTRHEAAVIARAQADEFSGRREAVVLGTSQRVDILNAAWVNALTSHVFDFDDTHLRTVIHPSPPIAPVVLALSEHMPVSGKQLVEAFVLGVEVACRIGNAVCPAHYNVGWHSTSTAGVFGAAAAAGKLIGLGEAQMCRALGLAGTQASGLRENLSTMGKFLHPGHAARDGLMSAFLARDGFTASEHILEAPRGFGHVLSAERNFDEITSELGTRFEILVNSYKPYPCGVVLHPAIEGCIELAREHDLAPSDIAAVSLRVNFLVLEVTGKRNPQTGVDGKFSIHHCVAVALVDRHAGEMQFTDAKVRDPAIVTLGRKVYAEVDPAVGPDEVRIEITLTNGRRIAKHVAHALGSLARPLTDRQLEDKFRELVEGILPDAQSERLVDLCWRLPELPDASDIARAAAV
jgi:2-methylcitrate dehydratase PrpD